MFLFIFKAISGNDDTIWHAQGKTTTLKKDMKKDSPGLVDIETKWNKLTKIGEVKTYENLRKQTRHDSLKALKDLKAASAVAWLGITSFGSGVSSAKMLCLSLPYLVSRIIWVTQFNLWKQVSIRNSVRSPRRFVYWINWFKNSFCSPINTLPAFLSPWVLEAPPYPNGTTHNLAYMSQRRNGHKQTVTNPTIGQTLHTRIHENSLSDLFRFNMIQPELIAIPAILHDTTVLQAMLRCVLSLATLQKGRTASLCSWIVVICNRVLKESGIDRFSSWKVPNSTMPSTKSRWVYSLSWPAASCTPMFRFARFSA